MHPHLSLSGIQQGWSNNNGRRLTVFAHIHICACRCMCVQVCVLCAGVCYVQVRVGVYVRVYVNVCMCRSVSRCVCVVIGAVSDLSCNIYSGFLMNDNILKQHACYLYLLRTYTSI